MTSAANDTLPRIIELKNVSQSYNDGKIQVIKDLNMEILDKPAQGQFAILLGMSGCGKSTLLRYIAGLQKPTSGTVLLNGKPVGPDNRASMVFQEYSSLPWMTVLDNVALPLKFKGIDQKERNAQAMEMIEMVGLKGQENKYAIYPNLSGGQLQRVAIARSLLANSSVLLMDEPFGALDIKTRLQMQELLTDIWNKFHSTILFVTHDISEAVFLGDEIFIMKAPPSNIVDQIDVNLPLKRTRDMKRDPKFLEIVHQIEDRMVNLSSSK